MGSTGPYPEPTLAIPTHKYLNNGTLRTAQKKSKDSSTLTNILQAISTYKDGALGWAHLPFGILIGGDMSLYVIWWIIVCLFF